MIKKGGAFKIYKRHNFQANANRPYSEMSQPKMPTPIRCELADNLSLSIPLIWRYSEVYKKAVIAPILSGVQS